MLTDRDWQYEQEVTIPSDFSAGARLQQMLLDSLAQRGLSDSVLFGIRLALEEALVNAIKHGNQMDPAKRVRVKFTLNAREFRIEIEDEGCGFDPTHVPDPTDPENLERPCGRGLFLMRAYMTECQFLPPGNRCRMRKAFC